MRKIPKAIFGSFLLVGECMCIYVYVWIWCVENCKGEEESDFCLALGDLINSLLI